MFTISSQTIHLQYNFATKLIFPLTLSPTTHHRYTIQKKNKSSNTSKQLCWWNKISISYKVYYDYPKLKSEHFKILLRALK